MNDRYLTVKEISKYLKIGQGTIRAWVRAKKIPYLRINGNIRFDKLVIDSWAKDCEVLQEW